MELNNNFLYISIPLQFQLLKLGKNAFGGIPNQTLKPGHLCPLQPSRPKTPKTPSPKKSRPATPKPKEEDEQEEREKKRQREKDMEEIRQRHHNSSHAFTQLRYKAKLKQVGMTDWPGEDSAARTIRGCTLNENHNFCLLPIFVTGANINHKSTSTQD